MTEILKVLQAERLRYRLRPKATSDRRSKASCDLSRSKASQCRLLRRSFGSMSDDDISEEFPGAPQQVEFWSLEIPPNKTVEARLSLLPGL